MPANRPVYLGPVALLVLPLLAVFVARRSLADEAVQRPLWTTSKITGSPEPPPPLKQVLRYPKLKFDQPLYIELDPAKQRLWVITRDAKVFSFCDEPDVEAGDLFVDLKDVFKQLSPHPTAARVNTAYGLAFHPDYPKVPVCWLTYTMVDGQRGTHLENGTRLSRFHVTFDDNGVPRCDVSSEKVLIAWAEGGHNGACLCFGPDGYLYVSAGDADVPNPPDPRRAGQDVTNVLSTVLRIDVNPTDDGPLYRIPPDNPFAANTSTASRNAPSSKADADVASALTYSREEALPEIWAYGFRNPWKMNFGPDGQLWVGDVGWEMYEMIYNVKPGGNYGWSVMEGPQSVIPDAKRGPTPILPPAVAYSHTEGASITGGFVYQGTKFPELRGKYIFGDYETRRIWAATITPHDDGRADTLENLTDLVSPSVRIVAFGEDSEGELLLLHFSEGTVYELQRNEQAGEPTSFPKRLSETGLFADIKTKTPAAGLVPFKINADMWRDGATATDRWLGLAHDEAIEVLPAPRRQADSIRLENMHFPDDSVLAQNIAVSDESGSDVIVETQVLHFDGTAWNGYSYVWNAEQTDAQLAPAAGVELSLAELGDFPQHRRWTVHSRSECMRCHNTWAGGPLAFTIPQLDVRDDHGSTSNQIERLKTAGLLSGDILNDSERLAAAWPPITDPTDETADVAARARAYLSVNCSHCHQNGAGGTATIDLRHIPKLDDMKTVGATPMQGVFQIAGGAIVAAGQPSKSVLLYRTACCGRGRMPHIGSREVDVEGVKLLRKWIASMDEDSASEIAPSLASTSAALELVAELDDGSLSATDRERWLVKAREAPPEIRNLFTRFQPFEYRQQLNRQLDPEMLLAINGDAARGATLFADKRNQCITCHRIGQQGGQIGPALDDVGKRLKPHEILTSILEPSKKIDPKFAAWTALTTEGQVHSGLLTERTDTKVALRNAKGDDVQIPREDLEELIQQTTSLMPDRLLNDLSDEQIADLLSYLVSRTEDIQSPQTETP